MSRARANNQANFIDAVYDSTLTETSLKNYRGDINYLNGRDTPLTYAASCGNIKLVEILVKDPRILVNKYANGETALIAASKEGRLSVVKALLSHASIQTDIVDIYNHTALVYAVKGDFVDIVKALLEKGANVNCKDNKGNSLQNLTSNPEIKRLLSYTSTDFKVAESSKNDEKLIQDLQNEIKYYEAEFLGLGGQLDQLTGFYDPYTTALILKPVMLKQMIFDQDSLADHVAKCDSQILNPATSEFICFKKDVEELRKPVNRVHHFTLLINVLKREIEHLKQINRLKLENEAIKKERVEFKDPSHGKLWKSSTEVLESLQSQILGLSLASSVFSAKISDFQKGLTSHLESLSSKSSRPKEEKKDAGTKLLSVAKNHTQFGSSSSSSSAPNQGKEKIIPSAPSFTLNK